MTTKKLSTIYKKLATGMMLFMVTALSMGCPQKTTVKGGNNSVAPTPTRVVARLKSCIKGRVVKEDDSGFAYVIVETSPTTSPKITDRNGYFEICYKSQRSNDGQQASVKVALPVGRYVVNVKREGYHAHPAEFEYKGKDINIGIIKMVEKSRPLPEVVKKKSDKEEKRTSGVGGRAPIPE